MHRVLGGHEALAIDLNMMWLYSLGGSIERVQGTRSLLLFVGLTGALFNAAQYIVQGPYFGGMSGVVYALFGYVWMSSRYEPASPYRIDGQTVALMLVWLVRLASRASFAPSPTLHTSPA